MLYKNGVMFGFSLSKLIFTVLAVLAVWHGFKWVSRLQELRDAESRRMSRGTSHRAPQTKKTVSPTDVTTEDMIECKICNTYVPVKGAASCGRDDCPYSG